MQGRLPHQLRLRNSSVEKFITNKSKRNRKKTKVSLLLNCFVDVYESISSVSLSEVTKGKGRTQEERVLRSYTEQEFWRCIADGLNHSLVSSVAQAAKD